MHSAHIIVGKKCIIVGKGLSRWKEERVQLVSGRYCQLLFEPPTYSLTLHCIQTKCILCLVYHHHESRIEASQCAEVNACYMLQCFDV